MISKYFQIFVVVLLLLVVIFGVVVWKMVYCFLVFVVVQKDGKIVYLVVVIMKLFEVGKFIIVDQLVVE